jgi:hypothetical protein
LRRPAGLAVADLVGALVAAGLPAGDAQGRGPLPRRGRRRGCEGSDGRARASNWSEMCMVVER